jgi:hypothetical protein
MAGSMAEQGKKEPRRLWLLKTRPAGLWGDSGGAEREVGVVL